MVKGEEDHEVGNISHHRDRTSLIQSTKTEFTQNYIVIKTGNEHVYDFIISQSVNQSINLPPPTLLRSAIGREDWI